MTLLATQGDLTAYNAGDQSQALEAADAMVRTYCGWHIAPSRTETVTIPNWWWTARLLLPTLYLTALSSVTVNGAVIDLTTVGFTSSGVVSWLPTSTVWVNAGLGDAVFVMTHGYASTPPDVLQVVLSLAARGISTSADGGLVARSRQVGQVSVSYSSVSSSIEGMFLPAEVATLRQYRIPALP